MSAQPHEAQDIRRTAQAPATTRGAAPRALRVLSRAELNAHRCWKSAYAGQRKDRRFYELVAETLVDRFEYGWFEVCAPGGAPLAIQPFFLVDQDLVEGAGARTMRLVERLRRLWPRLLKLRTLMVGCVAGEAHLDERVAGESVPAMGRELAARARELGASLVVLKEFPKRYRAAMAPLAERGFTRVPSLPMTRLDLGYADFEDYMTRALNSAQRRKLRKKFRAAEAGPPIELAVVNDASPFVAEIYPLYLATYARSSLHFEKLTPEFLGEIGRRMADKTRFFVWRRDGRIVAFSLCLLQERDFFAEYVGFDYRVALTAHLYHWCVRDMIGWAIANGYTSFRSSALNYDPKLHMRHRLDPIDLYVRHVSPLANLVLARVLPLIEPTRADPILKLFPNYAELWD